MKKDEMCMERSEGIRRKGEEERRRRKMEQKEIE
jgi:hypothetical protein